MKTYRICPKCNGTGESIEEGPALLGEIPPQVPGCSMCNSTGCVKDGIADDTILLEKLDYIHGKVTAIWNKVKPPN